MARVVRLLVVALPLLLGCTPGKRPFLMVQMCLANDQGVSDFIDELRAIATVEKMDFLDNSANTKRELDAVGYAGDERTRGSPVINIGVQRSDGLGIGAGNLGLPGYQVALGFSAGSSTTEAQAFANRVVSQLEQRWRISFVPAGSGAKPMAGCR